MAMRAPAPAKAVTMPRPIPRAPPVSYLRHFTLHVIAAHDVLQGEKLLASSVHLPLKRGARIKVQTPHGKRSKAISSRRAAGDEMGADYRACLTIGSRMVFYSRLIPVLIECFRVFPWIIMMSHHRKPSDVRREGVVDAATQQKTIHTYDHHRQHS